MRRGAEPAKRKAGAKHPVAGKSRKDEGVSDGLLQKRLEEALEREAATAEILEIISSSPANLEPVFEAILTRATRLCEAHLGVLQLREGDSYRAVAQQGASDEFQRWLFEGPRPLDAATGVGRALLEGRAIHIRDITDEPAYRERHPARVATVELGGARTFLAVPMLRGIKAIGAIVIYRPEVRPFTDKQVDLVQTFANQAVIAIENVRLFNELEARNRDLTDALERQTATGEVLGIIASSPTDVQPVFQSILASALRLCGATCGRGSEPGLSDPLTRIRPALERILEKQEPYPALVTDRHWNLVVANQSCRRVFGLFMDFSTWRLPRNTLSVCFDPAGLRPFIANWSTWAAAHVQQLHREVLSSTAPKGVGALLRELLSFPGVPSDWRRLDFAVQIPPLLPLELGKSNLRARFLSSFTSFNMPNDVMDLGLRIECMYPGDAGTERLVRGHIRRGPSRQPTPPASGHLPPE